MMTTQGYVPLHVYGHRVGRKSCGQRCHILHCSYISNKRTMCRILLEVKGQITEKEMSSSNSKYNLIKTIQNSSKMSETIDQYDHQKLYQISTTDDLGLSDVQKSKIQ